jgi:hypothetical protein
MFAPGTPPELLLDKKNQLQAKRSGQNAMILHCAIHSNYEAGKLNYEGGELNYEGGELNYEAS